MATRDIYQSTEVMTATPQKLQLMLIEAALRYGQKAVDQWQLGQDAEARESLLACQKVVIQILSAMRPDEAPELVSKVAGVYMFVLRSLIDAHRDQDAQKIADAMQVLQIERETWKQVCHQLTIAPSLAEPWSSDSISFSVEG
jgi:flagellar protein FliS